MPQKKMHMFRLFFILAVAFGFAALYGCDEKKSSSNSDTNQQVGQEGGSGSDYSTQDSNSQQQKDVYVWPDTQETKDSMQGSDYAGTAFGCRVDADCFGQKCCATPWGVKLCAAKCSGM